MRKYLLFILFIFIVGCTDETNKLIVFENNIGIKNGMLGTYKREKIKVSLCYNNSKYYMKYIFQSKTKSSIIEGTFIPSKVSNTSDYYIFSFPKMTMYSFDKSDKTKTVIHFKNLILYLKYEKETLLYWTNMLSDSEEEMNVKKIKDLIVKSYTETFIKEGERLQKIDGCSSNDIDFEIDKIKKKFSSYKLKK